MHEKLIFVVESSKIAFSWEMDTVKYDKYREALIKAMYHLAYDKENMEPCVQFVFTGVSSRSAA